jgi:hypothetical protein
MLSILVVAVIGFVVVIQILKGNEQKLIDVQVENSVGFVTNLHIATRSYYDTHCSDAIFVQPTPQKLVADNLLRNLSDVLLYGANPPVISITGIGGSVKFRYTYTFTTNALAFKASSSSSNAVVVGTTVTWVYADHSTATDSLSYNKDLLTAFGANFC